MDIIFGKFFFNQDNFEKTIIFGAFAAYFFKNVMN